MFINATDVNKAVLDDITIKTLGLISDKVEVVIADPDAKKTSVIINSTFFLFNCYISF